MHVKYSPLPKKYHHKITMDTAIISKELTTVTKKKHSPRPLINSFLYHCLCFITYNRYKILRYNVKRQDPQANLLNKLIVTCRENCYLGFLHFQTNPYKTLVVKGKYIMCHRQDMINQLGVTVLITHYGSYWALCNSY